MKLPLHLSIFASAFILGFSTSCKKIAERNEKATLNSNVNQHNTDANNAKGGLDQTDSEINKALGDIPSFGKTEGAEGILSSPLCGCTIDSSQIAQKILYFNFDGTTPCFSPSSIRSGQIKVELVSGNNWSQQGAILKETFINYKITRLFDNRSIQFNGVKNLTNINGNNWFNFVLGISNLKYKERMFNMAVSFDNSQSATWNSARITEWSYVPSTTQINFTASGDTTINGFSNVDNWGVNRFGDNFTTYYNAPVVSNTYCGLWRFNAGELVHNLPQGEFTLTLGVDQSGNPTPYTCAYGYKVAWDVNGNANSIVLSY